MAKLFRWELGRQQTGYEKMFLGGLSWPVSFDLYLLKYSVGHEIPPHVDSVDSGRHFRLNIILHAAEQGGEFVCDAPLFESRRIKLFRPDIAEHSVSKIIAGNRYVFSLGWLRR